MRSERYTAVAIVLHWAIAAAILANVLLGWWMHEAIEEPETAARAIAAYQVHKSVGLTVLALSLARLAWRFAHPPPARPSAMPAWEKLAALATHWAFYALMIAIPLSGWFYVSAGWSHENDRPLEVPTLYFGLFRVPHLLSSETLADGARAAVAGAAIEAHELLVWAMLALAALHVGAALKHWLWDRDAILSNMAPGLPVLRGDLAQTPADPRRRFVLVGGIALSLAFAGLVIAALRAPVAAPPPSTIALNGPESAASDPHGEDQNVPAAAPRPGTPAAWRVDRGASAIQFSGVHAGVPFQGRFARWRAEINFDPAALEGSSAIVTIETASASDGVPLHDEALPQAEWFDAAAHPTATFRTTRIRHRGGGEYEARGVLTLKGKALDVDLPFRLTIDGAHASMRGTVTIDRRDADLGMRSDPDADYVSREIVVTVQVQANRAP